MYEKLTKCPNFTYIRPKNILSYVAGAFAPPSRLLRVCAHLIGSDFPSVSCNKKSVRCNECRSRVRVGRRPSPSFHCELRR